MLASTLTALAVSASAQARKYVRCGGDVLCFFVDGLAPPDRCSRFFLSSFSMCMGFCVCTRFFCVVNLSYGLHRFIVEECVCESASIRMYTYICYCTPFPLTKNTQFQQNAYRLIAVSLSFSEMFDRYRPTIGATCRARLHWLVHTDMTADTFRTCRRLCSRNNTNISGCSAAAD